ncbi:MAG: phosphomannomutase [Myxococcales bacterium]
MTRTVEIREMMQTSGVGFGTSGARGLVSAMTDAVCCAYTLGFLQALRRRGEIALGSPVGIAGDRRSSTGRIMQAVAHGVRQAGHSIVHAGRVPSSAIALVGLERKIPTLMVTGSHIPDDRNGIKFNKTTGEILKEDEAAIVSEVVRLEDDFDAQGQLRLGTSTNLPDADPSASSRYVARWLEAFPNGFLRGKRIVVFGHSAVGRDLLVEILDGLGAETIRVGWSEQFIPVDTEAIRPEDVTSAREWAKEYRPFAIVSTDGDSDRPLVSDESGKWLRGDVLGVLTARFLKASAVVTPISSNTVVERSGAFGCVERTRIGSPYVIAAMNEAVAKGHQPVVGYEANGGFLTATPVNVPGGGRLSPLPTRDPVIVMLSVFAAAVQAGCSVSALESALPARATASGRIKEFPNEISRARLTALQAGGLPAFNELFAQLVGEFSAIDLTDGIRGTTKTDEIIHLRASGNAPELRCYAEADNTARADALSAQALELVKRAWL